LLSEKGIVFQGDSKFSIAQRFLFRNRTKQRKSPVIFVKYDKDGRRIFVNEMSNYTKKTEEPPTFFVKNADKKSTKP